MAAWGTRVYAFSAEGSWAVTIGFIVATLSMAATALYGNTWKSLLASLSFGVMAVAVFIAQQKRQPRALKSDRRFLSLNEDSTPDQLLRNSWPRADRDTIAQELLAFIANPRGTILPVIGDSGAGKSHYMRWVFPALLRQAMQLQPIRLTASPELRAELADALSVLSTLSSVVVVIDQAERLADLDTDSRSEVVGMLESAAAQGAACVLVVRSDRYAALRFLRHLPPPSLSVEFPRLDLTKDAMAEKRIREMLIAIAGPGAVDQVLKDLESSSEVVSGSKGLLAIDIQMAGFAVEQAYSDGMTIWRYLKHLRDIQGVYREFFELHIHAAQRPEVAISALYALSVAGERHLAHVSVRTLAAAIPESAKELVAVLDVLVANGLLERGENGGPTYGWVHDVYPARFRRFAATVLDAALRDSIEELVLSYAHNEVRATAGMGAAAMAAPPLSKRESTLLVDAADEDKDGHYTKLNRRRNVVIALWLIVVVGTLVRMVQAVSSDPPIPAVTSGIVNAYTLPLVWAAHLAWGVFTLKMLVAYFTRLNAASTRYLWLVLVLTGFASAVFGWCFPEWWLVPIGATGMAFGGAYWWLALRTGVLRSAEFRLRRTGGASLLYGALLIVLGLSVLVSQWLQAVLALVVIALAVLITRSDTSTQAIAVLLGAALLGPQSSAGAD